MRILPVNCLLFFISRGVLLAQPLLYEGLGISTGIPELRTRFPNSRHQFWDKQGRITDPGDPAPGESGRYVVYLAPNDPLGPVQFIELEIHSGATHRIRISLERPASSNRFSLTGFENRHPACGPILADLTKRYGKPEGPAVTAEERLQNKRYSWRGPANRLTLLCGRYLGRRAEFAMDVLLVGGNDPNALQK